MVRGCATRVVLVLSHRSASADLLAAGIRAIHEATIIHGDLKPHNILLQNSTLDPRGFTAKIADFGLSIKLDYEQSHVSDIN